MAVRLGGDRRGCGRGSPNIRCNRARGARRRGASSCGRVTRRDERRRCSRCRASPPRAKPAPYSKPEHRRQRQQRLAEVGLQLVEHRFAESRRNARSRPVRKRRRWSRGPCARRRSARSSRPRPSGTGHRTGVASTCSSVTAVGSGIAAFTSPTCVTYPRTRMPSRARSFFATAPAATRQSDSRALDAAAAAVVAEAILGVEREVGVAGAVLVLDVAVVAAALVGVAERGCRSACRRSSPRRSPDQISGASASSRWVVSLLCPGRRRARSGSRSSTD